MHEYDEEINLRYDVNMSGWDRMVRRFCAIGFVVTTLGFLLLA